jgi:hypothetical protein
MAALGALVVQLSLNYAEYTKGLDKSDQAALKFAQNTQKSFDAAAASTKEFFVGMATGAVSAAAAFVSIRTAIDSVTNAISTLADLNDMAQKTGSSVENLSKFQQLSVEFGHDFTAMDTAVTKLAKGMAQFDSSTNYTNRALKALGISARDSAGNLRDPSAVMIDISKALSNYSDSASKAAIVIDLFGKSGAEILPFLNDMADNVDRVTGVTAEAAAQADAFQDQIGGLKRGIDVLFQSLARDLVPTFSKIVAAFTDSAASSDRFAGAAKLAGSMIEQLVILGAATGLVFSTLGKTVGTAAEQLGAIAKLDFRGARNAGKDWYNEIVKDYAEYDKFVQSILVGNKKVEQSTQSAAKKPILKYQGGTEGPAAAISAYEKASKAAADYAQRLREETEAVGLNAVQTKLLAAAREAAKAPLESQRLAIMQEAQAWAEATQAQEASVAAAKAQQDAEKKRLDGYAALVSADEQSLQSLKAKNDLLQYGAAAVQAMGQADLQAALDRAWASDNVDPAVIDMLQQRLDLSKQIADETLRGESLQAAKDSAKAAEEEWTRVGQSIEQTGRLAFVQFAAHGVSSIKSIGQAIKLSIIDALYQLTVRKWVISIQASILASLGSSAANAAGSLFSNQAMAAGTTGLGSLSSLFGAGRSVFGAAGASAGTAFIGGPGTALGGSGLSGFAGLGSMFSGASAALPIVGAMFGLGALGSSFGAGKSIFGIKGDSILNFLPFAPGLIGILAGLFGKGPKQYGPQLLNGTFSDQGFVGNFQADWTRKVGLFGGKKRGTTDFPISPDQVNSLNATVDGIVTSIDAFIKATGDADRSLAGWTYTVRRQIDTQEQQEQLTKDLADSIGKKLIPEVVALQQKNEALADAMTRLSSEYSLTTSAIDLTGQSFGAVGLASLAARDDLVQLLGGLQSATSSLQPYFEKFYTDAERVASTTRLMNAQFDALGVTTIPQTNEQFRALVEAQDLSTEAGRQMFASLIQLAPAFATVTDSIQKAADDAAAAAQKVADSIQLLTTDSFATLFDYTKYIRLAANAGVTAAQPAGPVFQESGQTYTPSFAVGANELPHDMTAKVHKGERIIPAADNRELMRRLSSPNAANDALVAEIRQLRAELKAAHLAIAKNTSKTAKILDTWDGNGQPPERDA